MFQKVTKADKVGIAACVSVLAMVVFNIVVLASETGITPEMLTATTPLVSVA
ncbi:hypothetical protein [Paraurantiacibacter namhicola]|uniref:Uncharacterized protein n=1 Tax=Paraurantiacibacter namhicola TaxID=645517 RepID=A0A1C7DAK2_9SPHN|nr:hypothetical protein [Paraurantiacibacter namhicola]ANU08484.1 hypothetical protein A6F65_02199 [Paraurantiacibacter namhicola]